MKTFENFVNEMLITAIKKLRETETKPTDGMAKKTASFYDIVQLYEGKNIDRLIGALMQIYFSEQGKPCLEVTGKKITLQLKGRIGGSRRKKSRRLRRRKQRGGLEPIIVALILTGIVFACCAMIGVGLHITRTPDHTRPTS